MSVRKIGIIAAIGGCLSLSACGGSTRRPTLPTSPVEHLRLSESARAAGDDKKALEHLVRGVEEWPAREPATVGIWLATAPRSFAEMVPRSPEAREALRNELARLESTIQKGLVPDGSVVAMYVKLAKVAGQPERVVTTLDSLRAQATSRQLRAKGAFLASNKVEKVLAIEAVEILAAHGRADLLSTYAEDIFGFVLLLTVPAGGKGGHDCQAVPRQGSLLYAALIDTGEVDRAQRIGERTLVACPDVDAFVFLAKVAQRAGRLEDVGTFSDAARRQLDDEGYADFRRRLGQGANERGIAPTP